MADLLEAQLRVPVTLATGKRNELSVHVDGEVVARRGLLGFPGDEKLVAQVGRRLDSQGHA